MFVDLVGSTKLTRQLDPEDMRELIRAYHSLCTQQIKRFEGMVAKYMGDGVLAYFGWPKAHEGDAERAVRAGLAIIEAVGRIAGPTGYRVTARVGVETGLVVIGDQIVEGVAQEEEVVGDTPNLAARLQSLADPGTVIIGPATQRLVEDFFLWENLGPQLIKGMSDPVVVYRVRSEAEVANRFEAKASHGLTPLVGREEEIRLLFRRWEQAKDGEGQFVLLSGEAGVGKSRVLRGLRELLQNDPHHLVLYYGSSYYQNSAFYPVIRTLERFLGIEKADGSAQKLDKLEIKLVSFGVPETDTAPLLASLLSLPVEGRYPALEISPEQLKKRTLDMLVAMVKNLTVTNPVLMVVEDVHWIDPSTKEFVTMLIEQLQSARFCLLLSYRSEFVPPWSADAHITQLVLKRLTRKESAALVDRVTGGKILPAPVLEQIIMRTDGVPLFVEELTKAVVESGILQEAGDRFVLSGPLPPLAIPESLHDSLMARLDRLAPVKEVAQLGATLGRTFSHELLAAVSPLKSKDLDAALSQLVGAELLHRRGLPPEVTYEFKHALIQDTAYQSLLKSTRQQYHERIALTLEEQFEFAKTEPELLAHHYTMAGIADRAIDYWRRAGQKAVERSANLEAIEHLSKGLELLNTLPDNLDRTRLELQLLISLAVPLTAAKGYAVPEVEQTYSRARELCRQLGEPRALFPALYGMWRYYLLRAEYSNARELGRELLTQAERTGDQAFFVASNRALGSTLFYRGELVDSKIHLDRVIGPGSGLSSDLDTVIGDLYDVVDPRVTSRSYASWNLWMTGYPDQARSESEKAVMLANKVAHTFSTALALSFASWLYQFRRDVECARDRAEAAILLSTEQGFPFWVGWGRVIRGWALAERGGGEKAIQEIVDGIAFWREKGSELGRSYFLVLLAEACSKEGRIQEALGALDEAKAFTENTEERFWEAERCRLRGELLLQKGTGSEDEAEKCFNEALKVARHQQAKSLELRAAISLCHLWRGRSQIKESRSLLLPIYNWFTEGFNTEDLRQAKALLAELG